MDLAHLSRERARADEQVVDRTHGLAVRQRHLSHRHRPGVALVRSHIRQYLLQVRISAIVDACFRLIVDGESVLPCGRRGGAQELV
jgi:hypothetical protein